MNAHFQKLIELTILDLDENLSFYMIDSSSEGNAKENSTQNLLLLCRNLVPVRAEHQACLNAMPNAAEIQRS